MKEKSMTNKDMENTQSALLKLQEQIESGEMVVFNPDEAKALKEWSGIFLKLKGLVWLAEKLGATFKWLIAIAIAWAAFKSGLMDWIGESLKK